MSHTVWMIPLKGDKATPWTGCLLAFQAVISQKLYRTPIIQNKRKSFFFLTNFHLLYNIYASTYYAEQYNIKASSGTIGFPCYISPLVGNTRLHQNGESWHKHPP